jgi:hypothetical protein
VPGKYHRQLHGELGLIPPVEYEVLHHPAQPDRQTAGENPASTKPGI